MLTKEIKSLQHPIIKHFCKLVKSRKYRNEQKLVVVSGKNLIFEFKQWEVLFIKSGKPIPEGLEAKHVFFVTEKILKKITGLETPEPFAAVAKMPAWDPIKGKKWVLGLDQISDPGNLGTILRTSLALGWEAVFFIGSCADPFNDKALRAAKGATFKLPLQSGTIQDFLSWAEEEKMIVLIADSKGICVEKQRIHNPLTLVLGNEAKGVSQSLQERFEKISISIQSMESLNVAIAGAILMYTLKR